jgi:hypothetical protein
MKFSYLLFFAAFILVANSSSGQGLNRLMKKVENTADKAIDKAISNKANENIPTNSTNSSGTNFGRTKAQNKGGGLVTTPPDVKQNLADAETSFKTGSYGEARSAIQQAMLGVEMEIGQDILKSLPETISSLKKDPTADQVSSTGWGWAGLTIQRVYTGGDDKELTVTVANNSAWMSAINMYMANGAYSQTSNSDQNWKHTKVKGHKAIIEFSEDSGYKLSVPLGQSSILVYEGINFATEQDLMAAANTIDIEALKKKLGEQ